jgi:hypothetical protein
LSTLPASASRANPVTCRPSPAHMPLTHNVAASALLNQ